LVEIYKAKQCEGQGQCQRSHGQNSTGPPGGNRAFDRSCETNGFKTEQDEVGYGNFGFRVSVRAWVQFETNRQSPDERFGKSGLGDLGLINFWVGPTDPSVASSLRIRRCREIKSVERFLFRDSD